VRRGVPAPTELWIYKRGLLVLRLHPKAGELTPTQASAPSTPSLFCSGQFFSIEWEPRVCVLLERSRSFHEFLEVLRDRRYAVETRPPALRFHPVRSL
jgi:hypothetical protein